MGNRASIVLPEHNLNIYLHWNGGPESIAAFLKYAEDVGIRHDDYYAPRLAQIIGNFMKGTNSVGLSSGTNISPEGLDNGVYRVRFKVDNEPVITHSQYCCSDHSIKRITRTLSDFVTSVKRHEYWSSDDTIMDALAKANDQFFKAK